MKTIIILGGGVGGIVTANELSNSLKGEHKIILIEKNIEHTFAPSYLWLMNGDRKKKQINVPLKMLLKKNIEVVNALVNEIVPAEQKVKAGEKEYHYDFLVIALGADLAPKKIQGWDEGIHIFYRWVPDQPMMLPKAGVFAHIQADVVAKNIVKKIRGENASVKFCADGYCMLEAGEDLAGFAYGDFFGVPHPQVYLKKIGKKWHIGKVLFEKWWLSPIGLKKAFYKNLLQTGGRMVGIPVRL